MELTAADIWQEYQDGLDYQNSMSFGSKWSEYQRFLNGDQWPAPTEKTKNMPRPVLNMIKMTATQKSSNVLNENITMQFTPEEIADNNQDDLITKATDGATKFTNYSRTLWEKLDQAQLNENAIEDAVSLGTCIWHYYWDNSIIGGIKTRYVGDISGEVIDPSNIFFKNPKCQDVQKQPSIIISNDLPVSEVKELAKENKVPEDEIKKIESNEETQQGKIYDADKKEVKNGQRTTLLTRYYKKNKRVYFTKSTQNVIVQKETDLGLGSERGFKLYPIEVMTWYRRKKCIYGIGEIEGLIPNQKAINFNIGMMLYSVQQTAWPKIYTRLGALDQQLTNTPGEVVTDKLLNGADNIKYMQPPNFPYMAINIVDKIIEITRLCSGVTETATGEKIGASMAAAAIIALQNQAKVPIEAIQKRFYRSMKRVGRIWEEFFKTKYNMERSVVIKDAENNDVPMKFTGSDYEDMNFDLKIDVGPSSQFSESLAMATLDKLYDRQAIDTDTYIELAPDNVIPFKQRLKKILTEKAALMQEQALGQQNSVDVNKILATLTPEEQAAVQQNPELLNQLVGGGANGPMPQMSNTATG